VDDRIESAFTRWVADLPDSEEARDDSVLADDVVELRLLRILGTEDADKRAPEARFIGRSPEIRFSIHRRTDGLRVGRIHLRVTSDRTILRAVGHSGYEVDEDHRRQGYAVHALRLVSGLARTLEVSPFWVLIDPENIASRRTAERAGLGLIDIIDATPEAVALGLGPQLCRYSSMSSHGPDS
jgi:predicted acetyltransferase